MLGNGGVEDRAMPGRADVAWNMASLIRENVGVNKHDGGVGEKPCVAAGAGFSMLFYAEEKK